MSTRSRRGPFGWPITETDTVLEEKKDVSADWPPPSRSKPMSKAQLMRQLKAFMLGHGMRERPRGGQRYTEPPVCGVCHRQKVVKKQGQGKPTTWRCKYCQKRQRKRYQKVHPEVCAGVIAKYNTSEKGRAAKWRYLERVRQELPPPVRVKVPRPPRLPLWRLEQAAMSVVGKYLNQDDGPPPKRHNQRWTAAEEAKLVSGQHPVWGLAQILDRTETAITQRLFRLRRQQKQA